MFVLCQEKFPFFAFCSFFLLCFLSSEFTRFFRKIKGKRLRFRFKKEASGGESSRIGTGLSTEEAIVGVSDFVFESFRWKEKSRESTRGKFAKREDRVESWYRERHGQHTNYTRYRIWLMNKIMQRHKSSSRCWLEKSNKINFAGRFRREIRKSFAAESFMDSIKPLSSVINLNAVNALNLITSYGLLMHILGRRSCSLIHSFIRSNSQLKLIEFSSLIETHCELFQLICCFDNG